MENKRILGVIPARFASTRFPGKPLVKIGGREMVVRVYENVLKSGLFDRVVVATDSRQIFDVLRGYGYDVVMTSPDHSCGTERVEEALRILESQSEDMQGYDIIVNIQGDEPLISKEQLEEVLSLFEDESTEIGTLCKKIDDVETLISPNIVKIVFGEKKQALYFSRNVIPYDREETLEYGIAKGQYYKHIGLYAFSANVLKEVVILYHSRLERIEGLEQLRWLEEGYKIRVNETKFESIGIDTPEDLDKLNNR